MYHILSPYRRACHLWVIVFIIAGGVAARAQAGVSSESDSVFTEAVRLYQAGDATAAADLLERLVDGQPGYLSQEFGPAAYWLGKLLKESGNVNDAQKAWRRGVLALNQLGLVDARLSDAFVRATYGGHHVSDYGTASGAYLQLLQFANGVPDEEIATLLATHLEELAPVLPASLAIARERDGRWISDSGDQLATWWRGRDLVPATRVNERLVEHLQRATVARERYTPSGWIDIRGQVYIRLGEPSRIVSVDFDTREFRSKVVDRSITMQMSDFPENEIWLYDHISDEVVFLFYQEGGAFRIGEVRDLIPSRLMTGLGGTGRGQAKARAVVRTLEQIYRQLSLHNRHFVTRYSEVAAFAQLLDEQDMLSSAGEVGSEYDQVIINPQGEAPQVSLTTGGMTNRPDLFAQGSLNLSHSLDGIMAVGREEETETPYTNIFDHVERADMPILALRFLDADGSTRTELHWGIPPGMLMPSRRLSKQLETEADYTSDYLLRQTVVQRDAANFERIVQHDQFMLQGAAGDATAAVSPKTATARGDRDVYHIAAQWDLFPTSERAEGMRAREYPVKTFLAKLDSLVALSPGGLEMSDLKPVILPEGDTEVMNAQEASDATAYPFPIVRGGGTLWLYFEVYGLETDDDSESHFDVAYTVGPKGGRSSEITSVTTTYREQGAVGRELILLNLAEWRGEGAIQMDVSVRDRLSGGTVSRGDVPILV